MQQSLVRLGEKEIPPLGIGTMMWGTTSIDRLLVGGKLLQDSELQELVSVARQRGVLFFDTAEGYGGGSSEERLNTLGIKSPFVVSTKFLPTIWKWSQGQFESAVRKSLKRLGLESIDIYYIHTPVHPRKLEHWIEAGAKCIEKGLIKSLGISNCDAAQVKRAHEAAKKFGIRIASNQINLSLLSYNHPKLQETIKMCQDLDIQIVCFSVVGQGLLSETLTKERFEDGSIRAVRMTGLKWQDLEPLRQKLKEIAQKRGKEMSQVAINWAMCKGFIPLVGCKSQRHILNAADTLDWKLNDQEVEELDKVALSKSTLEKPKWKRTLFVVMISTLMVAYKVNRFFSSIASVFKK